MSHFLPCSRPSISSPKQLFGFVLCGLFVFFKQTYFIPLSSPPSVKRNSTTLQLPKLHREIKTLWIQLRGFRNYGQEHLDIKGWFCEKKSPAGRQGMTERILSADRRGSIVTVCLAYEMLRLKHQSGKKANYLGKLSPNQGSYWNTLKSCKPGLDTTAFSFFPLLQKNITCSEYYPRNPWNSILDYKMPQF